jgi:phosphohistidine phosphatase
LDGAVNPRTLVLLRHGKSAYPVGVPDHDRPLADRGLRQASLAGEHIRTLVDRFDLVLCSTATRARQTLDAAGLTDGRVEYRNEIYAAEPDEILDLIRAVPDGVTSVLVIGHAPGLPDLADELAGPGSDPSARARLEDKFPTSAFAVVAVSGSWSDLPGGARLIAVTVPRDRP